MFGWLGRLSYVGRGGSSAVGVVVAAVVIVTAPALADITAADQGSFLVPALTALLGHKAWWPGSGDLAPTDRPADVELATVP